MEKLEVIYLEREIGSESVPRENTSGSEGEVGDEFIVPTFLGSRLATAVTQIGSDLSIDSLGLTDPNPTLGSNIQLTAIVRNRGTVATPASTIQLFENGIARGTAVVVPALDVGEDVNASIPWAVPSTVARRAP